MKALLLALSLILAAGTAHAQHAPAPGSNGVTVEASPPAAALPPLPPEAFPAPFLLEPTPEEQLIGAVDVCVRWGSDPAHLTDVLMTNSSGDQDLDAKIPDMIRSIPWPRPDGDDGAWFGLALSFGAAPPHGAPPDCEALFKAAGQAGI